MDTFTAIAEPTRRSILEMLAARGDLSAGEIYAKFDSSAPAISQHLKVLRETKLVRVEKRGQQRIYYVNPQPLLGLKKWIAQFEKNWEDRFSVLDGILESELKKEKVKMANKTKVTAEPGKLELFITREFDAPREMVFNAHVDPDIYIKWVGPKDLTMSIEKWEPYNGGSYAFTHVRGEHKYKFFGVYHDITAPERIIGTFEFDGLPETGHVILGTTEFEELEGGRCRLVHQSVFQSVADRDGMIRSGMESGVREGYEKLDALLSKSNGRDAFTA